MNERCSYFITYLFTGGWGGWRCIGARGQFSSPILYFKDKTQVIRLVGSNFYSLCPLFAPPGVKSKKSIKNSGKDHEREQAETGIEPDPSHRAPFPVTPMLPGLALLPPRQGMVANEKASFNTIPLTSQDETRTPLHGSTVKEM